MTIRETEGMVVSLVDNYIFDEEGYIKFVGELPFGFYHVRVDRGSSRFHQIYMNVEKGDIPEIVRAFGKNQGVFVSRVE